MNSQGQGLVEGTPVDPPHTAPNEDQPSPCYDKTPRVTTPMDVGELVNTLSKTLVED